MALIDKLIVLEWDLLEAKGLPLGTVRKWRTGEHMKTKDGWVPVPASASSAKKPKSKAAPKTPVAPTAATSVVGAPSGSAQKQKKFDRKSAGKAFADLESDLSSPEKQKAVRETLNSLCADFGMIDRDTGTQGKDRILVKAKSELPPGVGGIHEWDGGIIIRDKSLRRASSLMTQLQSGAPYPDPMTKEYGKAEKGMHVLVHEAVHGHSPIRREQFKGRYRLLEEATTEMAARKVMHDAFGTRWERFSDPENGIGAYSDFCGKLYAGTKAALARKGFSLPNPADWYDFLGTACIEMRRREPKFDNDKNTYLRRYASSLPIEPEQLKALGGPDGVREEVAGAVWMALKVAKEQEKVMRVEGGKKRDEMLLAMALKAVKEGHPDAAKIAPTIPLLQARIQEAGALLGPLKKSAKTAEEDWEAYKAGGPLKESALVILAHLLTEAVMSDENEDAGMLPRNDIELAIYYAKALSDDGKLTPSALRDLALLQDNVAAAAKRLADAVIAMGMTVVPEPRVTVDGISF